MSFYFCVICLRMSQSVQMCQFTRIAMTVYHLSGEYFPASRVFPLSAKVSHAILFLVELNIFIIITLFQLMWTDRISIWCQIKRKNIISIQKSGLIEQDSNIDICAFFRHFGLVGTIECSVRISSWLSLNVIIIII